MSNKLPQIMSKARKNLAKPTSTQNVFDRLNDFKFVRNTILAHLKSNVDFKFLAFLMQWISSIFWICYKLNSSISEKCQKSIASKMLEIKCRHLIWVDLGVCFLNHSHKINFILGISSTQALLINKGHSPKYNVSNNEKNNSSI